MSRDIKYRLRQNDKIVGYEKWFSGKENEAEPKWLYSRFSELWSPDYIHHNKKDRFTGLLDKNGKEIFEGDLMKHENHGIVEIVFHRGSFMGRCIKSPNKHVSMTLLLYRTIHSVDEAVVIGNKFLNKELLEG